MDQQTYPAENQWMCLHIRPIMWVKRVPGTAEGSLVIIPKEALNKIIQEGTQQCESID